VEGSGESTVAGGIVAAYFRARMRARETAPLSLDDEFIGGLTYSEYFALSEEEKALWDDVFADEAMEIEDFTELEVAPDACVPYPGMEVRRLGGSYP
jgi:hypothetical protein